LIIHIGFRKFWWISWISILRPTALTQVGTSDGQRSIISNSGELLQPCRQTPPPRREEHGASTTA